MAATAALTLEEIRKGLAWRKQLDKVFVLVGLVVMLGCLATLAILFIDLVRDGASRFGWDFFTSFPSRKAERAGILSAAVGTTMIMTVTALVALPVGVAAAIYLEEYAPKNWFTGIIEINVTNLAGVPSIVYGLLALGLFVYQFGFGQSILSAGLTLALLILPIVIVTTREALRAIPLHIREAAYGCGASQWQVVSHHLVPYGLPGILTGVIIGLARAIGETAPIITIGALTFIAFLPPAPFTGDPAAGLFDWVFAPFTVMPIQIFNWTSRPDPAFEINAAAAGFVLMVMVLSMNAVAIYLRYKMRKNIKW